MYPSVSERPKFVMVKENKRQIQRKTKSIVKSLANLFMQSGNPGYGVYLEILRYSFQLIRINVFYTRAKSCVAWQK